MNLWLSGWEYKHYPNWATFVAVPFCKNSIFVKLILRCCNLFVLSILIFYFLNLKIGCCECLYLLLKINIVMVVFLLFFIYISIIICSWAQFVLGVAQYFFCFGPHLGLTKETLHVDVGGKEQNLGFSFFFYKFLIN